MKITLNLQKLHRQDLSAIANHNTRAAGGHAEPISVLPGHLHFGPNTSIEFEHGPSRIETAKSLAKRKDAVIVQSFLFQLGDKTDWRNLDGTVKKTPPVNINQFCDECLAFVRSKYTSENVIRCDLHLDETTPHFTIWTTPINKAGKLAQKSFIDGARSMKQFRTAFEDQIIAAFPDLDIARGSPGGGGKPHDPIQGAWQDHIKSLREESDRLMQKIAEADRHLHEKTLSLSKQNKQIAEAGKTLMAYQEKFKTLQIEIEYLQLQVKILNDPALPEMTSQVRNDNDNMIDDPG